MRKANLLDQRFGRLEVIDEAGTVTSPGGTKRLAWQCRCDCGNVVVVRGNDLVNGQQRSCGCLRDEMTGDRSRTHGHTANGKTSKEFHAWCGAKKRCYDKSEKSYVHYGGRGIRMCKRWRESFENFFADMGPCPKDRSLLRQRNKYSLDRYPNPNGNYEPGNCRWATQIEQCNNWRHNRIMTIRGQRMTVAQAARKFGLRSYLVYSRLYAGWADEAAIGIT